MRRPGPRDRTTRATDRRSPPAVRNAPAPMTGPEHALLVDERAEHRERTAAALVRVFPGLRVRAVADPRELAEVLGPEPASDAAAADDDRFAFVLVRNGLVFRDVDDDGVSMDVPRELGRRLPDTPLILSLEGPAVIDPPLGTLNTRPGPVTPIPGGDEAALGAAVAGVMGVRDVRRRARELEREAAAAGRDAEQARGALREANAELEATVARLEREVADRTRELEFRTAKLRELAAQLTRAEERERRRLARILHDDLQQVLVAARIHLSTVPHPEADVRPGGDPDESDPVRLVDDLLLRAVAISRNLTEHYSPTILYDAGLTHALEWLARKVKTDYGLEVVADCDPAAEPEAEDTRVLLYNGARELLFNVVKHAGGTTARLTLARVSLDDGGSKEAAFQTRLSVCDEGGGFAGADDGGIDPGRSAGFGLFSIRERLELIGGRLEIESEAGRGACVRLYAPLSPIATPVDGEDPLFKDVVDEHAAARSGPAIRVIVADDQRIFRETLAALLNGRPEIEVVGRAADGKELLTQVAALVPDVVVTDLTMPVLDGVEATRRIKAGWPEVLVLGLSMHEDEESTAAMLEAGAERYVTKDGPPEMLLAAIHACVRNS